MKIVSIDIHAVLDEMERTRHRHQHEHPRADWCMRVMEAILAREAGYTNRNDWTEELKQIPGSFYAGQYGKEG